MKRIPKLQLLVVTIAISGITALYISVGTVLGIPQNQIETWVEAEPLDEPIDSHRMVLNQNHLLIIGGRRTGEVISDVLSAPLQSDGSLGKWESTTPLPTPVYLHAVFSHEIYVYALGGWDDTSYHSEVWRASVNTGGKIEQWEGIDNYYQKIALHSAVTVNDRVFVIGGVDDVGTPLSEIRFTTINNDGTLNSWSQTEPLPEPRVLIATANVENRIYVAGGTNGSTAQTTVYYTSINNDGTLASWQEATDLPIPVYFAEAFVQDDKLYVAGGAANIDLQFDTIYSAIIQPDGSLGAWNLEPVRLPAPMYRFASTLIPRHDSGYVYISGGRQGETTFQDVYHSNIPTPMPTATSAPAIGLRSEPMGSLAYGQNVAYIVDITAGSFNMSDVVVSNAIPDGVELVPDSIVAPASWATAVNEDTRSIEWTLDNALAKHTQVNLSYTAKRHTPTPVTATPESVAPLTATETPEASGTIPPIINEGARIEWVYQGTPAASASNRVRNPPYFNYVPFIFRNDVENE